MFDGQLDCRKMREADWNGTPDGISTRQSSTGGTLMTDSNANKLFSEFKSAKDFDAEVKRLRAEGVEPKLCSKRKKMATSYRWAQHLEYNTKIVNKRATVRKARKDYQQKNAEKKKTYHAQYYKDNKDTLAAAAKQYYNKHADVIKSRSRQYRIENIQKVKATQKRYAARRLQTDVEFRIRRRIRTRGYQVIRNTLDGVCVSSAGAFVKALGVPVTVFMEHLESLFDEHMTWDNWGTYWEIDHIYPLDAANLHDKVEFLAVLNWRNQQPLTVPANREKWYTVTPEAQELFDSLKEEFSEHLAAQKERITCNQH